VRLSRARDALGALALACASLAAQVSNDTCATAVALTGIAVAGTNVGATTGPDPLPGCAPMTGDVWYAWTAPCSGTYTASTCAAATSFSTIVAVWGSSGSCATLLPLACSDVCSAGAFQGASATFQAVTGGLYYVSVGGNSGTTGAFELSLTLGAAMSVAFFDSGPGTLGYAVSEGPGNGTAFVAITLNQGNFPVGWFLGLDIAWLELINELSAGYPFVVPLQPCGAAVVGPFAGLPPGLVVFGVGLALPPGGTVPTATSLPTFGMVP
jgi:hypothetical protein